MLNISGDYYSLPLGNKQSDLLPLPLHWKRSNTTSSSNLFTHLEGSGEQDATLELQVVHFVFRHHIYIVVDSDVVVLTTSKSPAYEVINIGHIPLQIKVYDYGGELHLFVLYVENSRGYVATFRKYGNSVWGRYGSTILVYSPQWYDLEKISNVEIFMAQDIHLSHNTIYIALGIGWYIHVCEIIDGVYFSLSVPKPCDNIMKVTFNEHEQTMFIECAEATMYYDFMEDHYYSNSHWEGAIGTATRFSQDGRFGAIVSNDTAQTSIVTVLNLHIHDSLHYFHLAGSIGEIAQLEFVSVNHSKHYLCYMEYGGNGVNCVDVELGLENPNMTEIRRLPNTEGICDSTLECPSIYSHHSILTVNRNDTDCGRSSGCHNTLLVFNMSTLENKWNVTGIQPVVLAWKPHPEPIILDNVTILVPNLENETDLVNTTDSSPTTNPITTVAQTETETTHPHVSMSTTDTATQGSAPSDLPTTDTATQGSASSDLPTTDTATQGSASSDLPTTDTATQGSAPSDPPTTISSCDVQLQAANQSYERLLWITIILCVAFCFAMITTLILLVIMICLTRTSTHGTTTHPHCSCAHREEKPQTS